MLQSSLPKSRQWIPKVDVQENEIKNSASKKIIVFTSIAAEKEPWNNGIGQYHISKSFLSAETAQGHMKMAHASFSFQISQVHLISETQFTIKATSLSKT